MEPIALPEDERVLEKPDESSAESPVGAVQLLGTIEPVREPVDDEALPVLRPATHD